MFQIPYYNWHEMAHTALVPYRAFVDLTRQSVRHHQSPLSNTLLGKHISTTCDLFERATRNYDKPAFIAKKVEVNSVEYPIQEHSVLQRPFCDLVHFEWDNMSCEEAFQPRPKLLFIPPMSGNYAALFRNMVESLFVYYDIYIVDWKNARDVPLSEGLFDFDEYMDYVLDIFHFLGHDVHALGVSQSCIPLLAATALLEEDGEPVAPCSLTLLCGPLDTRINPTFVDELARDKDSDWFHRHVLTTVPHSYPGAGRLVYPGFLHRSGGLTMPMSGRMGARVDQYMSQLSAELYNFYNKLSEDNEVLLEEEISIFAPMDLPAEFFVQAMDMVFVRHTLANGELYYRNRRVDLSAIHHAGLMTVEAEKDIICGPGQTEIAHKLCPNIPAHKREKYVQHDMGHFFYITPRFQSDLVPHIRNFINECSDKC